MTTSNRTIAPSRKPRKNTTPKPTPAAAAPSPSPVLDELVEDARRLAERARAAIDASFARSEDTDLPEASSIVLCNATGRAKLLADVLEAALAAVDVGRDDLDHHTRVSLTPARRIGRTMHPAELLIRFGRSYQVIERIAPIGDAPGRWHRLADQAQDFASFAHTWGTGSFGPKATDEELDQVADRVVALATWPRLDALREMFRDIDRNRRAARKGGAA